jgi:hypothetical protein
MVVLCGWVIFRSDDLGQAGLYSGNHVQRSPSMTYRPALVHLMDLKNTLLMLCSATALILPSGGHEYGAPARTTTITGSHGWNRCPVPGVLLPWCLAILASGSPEPVSSITGSDSDTVKQFLSIIFVILLAAPLALVGGRPGGQQWGQHRGPAGISPA